MQVKKGQNLLCVLPEHTFKFKTIKSGSQGDRNKKGYVLNICIPECLHNRGANHQSCSMNALLVSM